MTRRTPLSPNVVNTIAAVSFTVGGSLFAIGALVAQYGSGSASAIVYLVGGVFFSLGGYTSIVLARDDRSRPEIRSAVILFIGTLLFAISLIAAVAGGLTVRQNNHWVWLPDMLGCVCFLVSGYFATIAACGGELGLRPRDAGWWVVMINLFGSVFFLLAGLAAYTSPATSELLNEDLANWGTFVGAAAFAVAGVMQAFEQPDAAA